MGMPIIDDIETTCPYCDGPVRNQMTRYGLRSSCDMCELHSWDGKPLVSQAVHDARQAAHAAFDPIWQNAEEAYDDITSNRQRKKVRRIMRNRAYLMISELTGLPEPECHMSEQEDLEKLALIESTAKTLSPKQVRDWWTSQNGAMAEAFKKAVTPF